MSYKAYIVDAFTDVRFAGNQAAVCLIPEKLSDAQYQKIGAEFNLSETSFSIPLDGDSWKTAKTFSLRWFTPTIEVKLCGHATLATAHVIFNEIGNQNEEIAFTTLSGELRVKKSSNGLIMDFPAYSKTENFSTTRFKYNDESLNPLINEIVEIMVPHLNPIRACLYTEPQKLLIVLDPETTKDELLSIKHNSDKLLQAHDGSKVRGIVITFSPKDAKKQGFIDSEGKSYDYVSRYFAPWAGINEDPATGSSQCALGPFWSNEKNKNGPFYAFQCYPGRGAQFKISFPTPGRVNVEGQAVTVFRGEIELEK
ncbi:hypothetical protein FO519_004045 [Halicephalobus sp. NKZ332]|nr:hypothetical protein FO519_004045 [Halicephalobus sp. NKZ332]